MSTTQNAQKKISIARAQENLYAYNIANVVADMDTSSTGTVYNPFSNKSSVSDGVATTLYPISSYSVDADSIRINRRATVAEHVDNYDEVSTDFSIINDRADNAGKSIAKVIDGYAFGLPVASAGVASLDDGDFGGTAGNPKTTSDQNINDVINLADTTLAINDAYDKKFAVLSPYEMSDMRGYLQDTGNIVADEVIRNGIQSRVQKSTTFSGVDIFSSNNLTNVAVLSLATNPSDGDTISFLGVTYTFVATLSGAAGEVHITASVDATRANLAEAITGTNFPGDTDEAEATNTGYSALSTDDIATLSRARVTAVNDNTADTLTITATQTMSVSETLTDATDAWGTVYRYLVFGDYGAISMFVPSQGMTYVEKDVTGKHGKELEMSQIYNGTIWTRNQERILTIKVN